MSDKLPAPKQCIATGKAIIEAYGEGNGIQLIKSNISSLREAHQIIYESNQASTGTLLSIAIQSDFWSQVLESTK